jgi:hypothetical protein
MDSYVCAISAQEGEGQRAHTENDVRAAHEKEVRCEMARIERYEWICLNDSQSCQACKDKNGQSWRRKKQIPVRPPLPACTSPEGCRCGITPVYDDEGVVHLE